MQKLILLFLVLILISCSNSSDEEKTTTDTLSQTAEPATGSKSLLADNAFTRFLSGTDSSYSIEKFESTGRHPLPGMESAFDNNSIKEYKGLLAYNSDSTKALDLFSYGTLIEGNKVEGGEPDSEAALLDFTTMKRTRLLYFGPSYGFADAGFKNNLGVIAGYERINEEQWRPIFWVIDVPGNTVETFEYSDTLTTPLKTFFEQRYPGYRFF